MVAIALSGELTALMLLAVNVILYGFLLFTLLRGRMRRVRAKNLAEAFKGLEMALQQAAPGLPAAFTWEEAMAHLNSSGVQTKGMENALRGYEDYRYGGMPLPNVDYHEVVAVANRLGGINRAKSGG